MINTITTKNTTLTTDLRWKKRHRKIIAVNDGSTTIKIFIAIPSLNLMGSLKYHRFSFIKYLYIFKLNLIILKSVIKKNFYFIF